MQGKVRGEMERMSHLRGFNLFMCWYVRRVWEICGIFKLMWRKMCALQKIYKKQKGQKLWQFEVTTKITRILPRSAFKFKAFNFIDRQFIKIIWMVKKIKKTRKLDKFFLLGWKISEFVEKNDSLFSWEKAWKFQHVETEITF